MKRTYQTKRNTRPRSQATGSAAKHGAARFVVNGANSNGVAHTAPSPIGNSERENQDWQKACLALERTWQTEERWKGIVRYYSAEKVLRLSGTMKIEHTIADRMSRKLWELLHTEAFVPALGALTGNQAVQMAQAGLKAIYLSGWQVAADANLSASTYPDQSLYPANSVPMVVRRTNKALQRADQIQSVAERGHSPERRTASSASATPNSNALAEAAARLPQQAGEVNPSGETSKPAVIRTSLRTGMSALREQTDYWLPIVADAEAGFGGPLNAFELMQQMIEEGAAGVHFEDQLASAKKCGHMGGKVLVPAFEFINKLMAARLAADVMGVPTVIVGRTDAEAAKLLTSDFDERDKPFCTGERTSEGFFRIRAGLDLAIARALAYAPYADVLWCETSKPNLAEARRFAEEVKDLYPDKLLAYNCSPSFNWRMNLDEVTIAKFQRELGAMGYKFQFVTLAGFHALNYSMWELARGYRERQMAAYTELQEKEFAAEAEGYSAVKHQAFVGAGYFDEITSICGGCSTQALKDSTEEEQFQDKVPASA